MSATIAISDKNFESDVINAKELVLVDFWAEWCGPCLAIAPVLEELAVQFAGRIKVAKINYDENPELGQKFNIMSIPTLMLFKGGQVAAMRVGGAPKTTLANWIEQHI